MDEELKKLREELGLKHIIKPESIKPEYRGKSVVEIIRAIRKKYS